MQTGLRKDYFHCEEKNLQKDIHRTLFAGSISSPLHPLKMKEHVIPHPPQ
jgi:hypothetical protein